jgi:selenide,water dikinase
MEPVRFPPDARVLVSTSTSDDAGVVRLGPDLALVQTVDFFPPMVDDPTWFGRIAAANALSDIWAMGGTPVSAVDMLAVPNDIPSYVPGQILNGAIEKMTEAGAALVGGHTIVDKGMKFGLAVTGTVHPDRIVTNAAARPGDALVLTKPLGLGFVTTAIKRDAISEEELLPALELMATLNKAAAEAMVESGVRSATDVTGFGLLGHACGMADGANVTMRFRAKDLPRLDGGLERHFTKKNVCGGLKKNLAYGGADDHVRFGPGVSEVDQDLAADPQTSGGLLMSVPADRLSELLKNLERRGVATRAVVGEVVARKDVSVEVL